MTSLLALCFALLLAVSTVSAQVVNITAYAGNNCVSGPLAPKTGIFPASSCVPGQNAVIWSCVNATTVSGTVFASNNTCSGSSFPIFESVGCNNVPINNNVTNLEAVNFDCSLSPAAIVIRVNRSATCSSASSFSPFTGGQQSLPDGQCIPSIVFGYYVMFHCINSSYYSIVSSTNTDCSSPMFSGVLPAGNQCSGTTLGPYVSLQVSCPDSSSTPIPTMTPAPSTVPTMTPAPSTVTPTPQPTTAPLVPTVTIFPGSNCTNAPLFLAPVGSNVGSTVYPAGVCVNGVQWTCTSSSMVSGFVYNNSACSGTPISVTFPTGCSTQTSSAGSQPVYFDCSVANFVILRTPPPGTTACPTGNALSPFSNGGPVSLPDSTCIGSFVVNNFVTLHCINSSAYAFTESLSPGCGSPYLSGVYPANNVCTTPNFVGQTVIGSGGPINFQGAFSAQVSCGPVSTPVPTASPTPTPTPTPTGFPTPSIPSTPSPSSLVPSVTVFAGSSCTGSPLYLSPFNNSGVTIYPTNVCINGVMWTCNSQAGTVSGSFYTNPSCTGTPSAVSFSTGCNTQASANGSSVAYFDCSVPNAFIIRSPPPGTTMCPNDGSLSPFSGGGALTLPDGACIGSVAVNNYVSVHCINSSAYAVIESLSGGCASPYLSAIYSTNSCAAPNFFGQTSTLQGAFSLQVSCGVAPTGSPTPLPTTPPPTPTIAPPTPPPITTAPVVAVYSGSRCLGPVVNGGGGGFVSTTNNQCINVTQGSWVVQCVNTTYFNISLFITSGCSGAPFASYAGASSSCVTAFVTPDSTLSPGPILVDCASGQPNLQSFPGQTCTGGVPSPVTAGACLPNPRNSSQFGQFQCLNQSAYTLSIFSDPNCSQLTALLNGSTSSTCLATPDGFTSLTVDCSGLSNYVAAVNTYNSPNCSGPVVDVPISSVQAGLCRTAPISNNSVFFTCNASGIFFSSYNNSQCSSAVVSSGVATPGSCVAVPGFDPSINSFLPLGCNVSTGIVSVQGFPDTVCTDFHSPVYFSASQCSTLPTRSGAAAAVLCSSSSQYAAALWSSNPCNSSANFTQMAQAPTGQCVPINAQTSVQISCIPLNGGSSPTPTPTATPRPSGGVSVSAPSTFVVSLNSVTLLTGMNVTAGGYVRATVFCDSSLGLLSFNQTVANASYSASYATASLQVSVSGSASVVTAALQYLQISVFSTVLSSNPVGGITVAQLGGGSAFARFGFTISCANAAAPDLTQVTVRFNELYTAIVLTVPRTFYTNATDSATFQCNQSFSLTSGSLAAKLGVGAYCLWNPVTYTVIMVLGTAPTIQLSDTIVVLTGYISACASSTNYAFGPLGAIQLPATTPSVSVFGPSSISTSSCGATAATATFFGSVTALGAISTVTWTVNGSVVANCSSPSTCAIPATMFVVGVNQVVLTVTNFLGLSRSGSLLVNGLSSGLTVFASGPSSAVPRSVPLYLLVTARSASCNSSMVTCLWTLPAGVNASSSLTSLYLGIAPYQLQGNRSYTFAVTCTAADNSTGSSSVTVTTQTSSPLCGIKNGGYVTISASSSYVLDASPSSDPDATAGQRTLNYSWSCNAFVGSCPSLNNTVTTTIAPQQSSALLVFTLTVTKSSLTCTTTQTVQIQQQSPPQIRLLSFPDNGVILPTAPIQLLAIVSGATPPYSYAWSVYSGSLSLASIRVNRTFLNVPAPAGGFPGGSSFIIQLQVSDSIGATALAQKTITIAQPPIGGVVTCTPSTGVAFTTTFSISVTTQPQSLLTPLTYSFYRADTAGNKVPLTAYPSTQFSWSQTFGLGDPNNNSTIVLGVTVTDTLGGTADYNCSVVSSTPSVTTTTTTITTLTSSLMGTITDPNAALASIQSLASTFTAGVASLSVIQSSQTTCLQALTTLNSQGSVSTDTVVTSVLTVVANTAAINPTSFSLSKSILTSTSVVNVAGLTSVQVTTRCLTVISSLGHLVAYIFSQISVTVVSHTTRFATMSSSVSLSDSITLYNSIGNTITAYESSPAMPLVLPGDGHGFNQPTDAIQSFVLRSSWDSISPLSYGNNISVTFASSMSAVNPSGTSPFYVDTRGIFSAQNAFQISGAAAPISWVAAVSLANSNGTVFTGSLQANAVSVQFLLSSACSGTCVPQCQRFDTGSQTWITTAVSTTATDSTHVTCSGDQGGIYAVYATTSSGGGSGGGGGGSSGLSTGAIIGIAVGAGGGLLVILAVVCLCMRRNSSPSIAPSKTNKGAEMARVAEGVTSTNSMTGLTGHTNV